MTNAAFAHAHPLVRDLHTLATRHKTSLYAVGKRAGVSQDTIYGWTKKHSPQLELIVACFNALGYDLVVQRVTNRA